MPNVEKVVAVVSLAVVLALGRDADAQATERMNPRANEVIVLEDTRQPAVMPQPVDPKVATRAPPYSDKAIAHDAWVRAWMLLDVDERGVVTRLKLLKRPGYDLDEIAVREGFKLRFTPARDAANRPVKTLILWPIEWVANSWLVRFGHGTRTRMPEKRGPEGRSAAAYVPCRGSGPWKMGSLHKGYRDCSTPDLAKAKTEPWILRP